MGSPTSANIGANGASSVGHDPVKQAIANAARDTSVDFDYLLSQAQIESGLNPNAKAGTSSASGLYQFISSTWLDTLDRHGAKHGLRWAADAIDQGKNGAYVDDPEIKAELLALRYNPEVAAVMAAEFANDNAAVLRSVLGRSPDSAELYLAHFLGAGGARSFLRAYLQDPNQSAPEMFPQAAAANRNIFYDKGTPRTLGGVMDLIRSKMQRALVAAYRNTGGSYASAGAGTPAAKTHTDWGSYFGGGGATTAAPTSYGPGGLPSMADTLESTFGGAEELPGRASEQVNEAYERIKAFKL